MHARTLGTFVLTTLLAIMIAFAVFVGSARAALDFPTVADLDTGSLIVAEGSSTVYYFGIDEQRYGFQNENTYFTWFDNFDDVITITDEEMAMIPFENMVTYFPLLDPVLENDTSSRLLKIQTDPTVYAPGVDGILEEIDGEDAAIALFGEDWASYVDDLPDSFFSSYAVTESSLTEETVLYDWLDAFGGEWSIDDDKSLSEVAGVMMYSDPSRFAATDESEDCGDEYCAYNEVTVTSGNTIKLVNYTEETMTVREANNDWSTGPMEVGDIVVLTVDSEAGTYYFSADEDEEMVGVLIVE